MFQLILPFQLDLPFDGAPGRGASANRRDPDAGRAKPLAAVRELRSRAKPGRRERRSQGSHSLELPLIGERSAREVDA